MQIYRGSEFWWLATTQKPIIRADKEKITITNDKKMDPETIEKMIQDAELYAEEDAKLKSKVEVSD